VTGKRPRIALELVQSSLGIESCVRLAGKNNGEVRG
jgi:hypothetical protein